jgi:hypothetical protein
MGIRTPDLLHAIQRQDIHRSPFPQVAVPADTQGCTGIRTRCVLSCCTHRQVHRNSGTLRYFITAHTQDPPIPPHEVSVACQCDGTKLVPDMASVNEPPLGSERLCCLAEGPVRAQALRSAQCSICLRRVRRSRRVALAGAECVFGVQVAVGPSGLDWCRSRGRRAGHSRCGRGRPRGARPGSALYRGGRTAVRPLAPVIGYFVARVYGSYL